MWFGIAGGEDIVQRAWASDQMALCKTPSLRVHLIHWLCLWTNELTPLSLNVLIYKAGE